MGIKRVLDMAYDGLGRTMFCGHQRQFAKADAMFAGNGAAQTQAALGHAGGRGPRKSANSAKSASGNGMNESQARVATRESSTARSP